MDEGDENSLACDCRGTAAPASASEGKIWGWRKTQIFCECSGKSF